MFIFSTTCVVKATFSIACTEWDPVTSSSYSLMFQMSFVAFRSWKRRQETTASQTIYSMNVKCKTPNNVVYIFVLGSKYITEQLTAAENLFKSYKPLQCRKKNCPKWDGFGPDLTCLTTPSITLGCGLQCNGFLLSLSIKSDAGCGQVCAFHLRFWKQFSTLLEV